MADDLFQSTGTDQFESTEDDQWTSGDGSQPGGGYAQVGPLLVTAEINGGVVSGHELGNVNQRQSLGIKFSWRDLNGDEVLANGWCVIRDLDTKADIRAKEDFSQQATLDLFLYAHENELRVITKATEQRAILLCLTYGSSEQATARYEFTLVNLGFNAEDFA